MYSGCFVLACCCYRLFGLRKKYAFTYENALISTWKQNSRIIPAQTPNTITLLAQNEGPGPTGRIRHVDIRHQVCGLVVVSVSEPGVCRFEPKQV